MRALRFLDKPVVATEPVKPAPNLCLHCGEDLNHASQLYIHECTRWALGAPKQLKPRR